MIAASALVCEYVFVMRGEGAQEVGRDLGIDEDGSCGRSVPAEARGEQRGT